MRNAWVAAIAAGAFVMACSGGKEPVVGADRPVDSPPTSGPAEALEPVVTEGTKADTVGIGEESQPATPPVSNDAGLSGVVLQRTACRGSCPVYAVEIHRDGRVKYEGSKYVRVFGVREATIGAAAAAKLLDSLDRALWETKWRSGCTRLDHPDALFTFRSNKGESLRVQFSDGGNCPTDMFSTTADQIDLAAKTSKWVKCPGGKCPARP